MITSSRALNEIGVQSTSLQFLSHKFGFKTDICLNLERLPINMARKKIEEYIRRSASSYDVFHYHDMPEGVYTPTYEELKILKDIGKPLVIQHHGSEVRRLSVARNFNNPYVQVKNYWQNETIIINRLQQWGAIFDHAIVADHELYPYVKDYYKNVHIIRQPIDLNSIMPSYPIKGNQVPLIVHAPTNQKVKGTQYILEAVEMLKKEGYKFKFMLLQNVSHDFAKTIFQKADIIIDQLCIGAYGTFSIEGMAFGKPVVCYIRKDLIRKYPKDLPIVNANPANIYTQMKRLITNHDYRNYLGRGGRKYVENHHNSIKIARELHELYKKIM
ncbi:glycosyltransferase family 4 protein [Rossellomorea vietnamensis]|uniref:glycosyltransferase family 4 protein n=1 Tax=Rossellomorea vietnamensis TaxID=218284 RepID=UPI00077C3F18|nr:glycosyltransferase family 4 protein [Rossellomorea vietnamensis]